MDSSTLLLQATDSGSHDLITDIISNSKISASNLDLISNADGDGLLHLAASKGHTNVLKVLLQNGMNVDRTNSLNQTALFHAGKGGFLHCVQLLIQFGADANVKDTFHQKALDYVNTTSGFSCQRLIKLAEQGLMESRAKDNNGHWTTVTVSQKGGQKAPEISSKQHRPRNSHQKTYKDSTVINREMMFLDEYKEQEHFSVVSYNVLADDYTKPHYFEYASSEVLSWNFRLENLVKEMISLKSDVYCLQEVDKFSEFQEKLSTTNYKGIFKKRTGSRRDGCAIFYDSSKLALIEIYELEYMVQDGVAIFAIFQLIDSKKDPGIFAVGTTHLYYKDEGARKDQVKLVSNKIDEISKTFPVPFIFTGDFNTGPKGFAVEHLINQSKMKSAYHHEKVLSQSAKSHQATSFTTRMNYLDYIFYRELSLVGVLELPVVTAQINLPNNQFSSDHIAIKSVFSL